jgi:hypothetical protein
MLGDDRGERNQNPEVFRKSNDSELHDHRPGACVFGPWPRFDRRSHVAVHGLRSVGRRGLGPGQRRRARAVGLRRRSAGGQIGRHVAAHPAAGPHRRQRPRHEPAAGGRRLTWVEPEDGGRDELEGSRPRRASRSAMRRSDEATRVRMAARTSGGVLARDASGISGPDALPGVACAIVRVRCLPYERGELAHPFQATHVPVDESADRSDPKRRQRIGRNFRSYVADQGG